MKAPADWKQFEKEICKWLAGLAKKSNLEFRNSNQAIIGFPNDGFRSDGMVTNGETLFAVEVEAKQTHPDTNTGKYWLLHSRFRKYKKIVLIHIFTPAFDSYGWRKELAKFHVENMKKVVPIEYLLIELNQDQEYISALQDTKQALEKKVCSEFGIM